MYVWINSWIEILNIFPVSGTTEKYVIGSAIISALTDLNMFIHILAFQCWLDFFILIYLGRKFDRLTAILWHKRLNPSITYVDITD